MSQRFEDILNICLDRIANGDSIDACLQSYPDQASNLEPLLRTALYTRETYSNIKAGTEFERVARFRFQSYLHTITKKGKAGYSGLQLLRHSWIVAIAVVLVLCIASGSTVAASSNSLPGDILYPVKRTTEKVQGFFTFGQEAKARFHIKLGQRRLNEMQLLEMKGRIIPDDLLAIMNSETEVAVNILSKKKDIRSELVYRLITLTDNQKAVLERIEANVPESARLRFREALERSRRAHESAISLRELMPELKHNMLPELKQLNVILRQSEQFF